MITVELDDTTYTYLLQILNERYYSETDLNELRKINQIYKQLRYKSESWLTPGIDGIA